MPHRQQHCWRVWVPQISALLKPESVSSVPQISALLKPESVSSVP